MKLLKGDERVRGGRASWTSLPGYYVNRALEQAGVSTHVGIRGLVFCVPEVLGGASFAGIPAFWRRNLAAWAMAIRASARREPETFEEWMSVPLWVGGTPPDAREVWVQPLIRAGLQVIGDLWSGGGVERGASTWASKAEVRRRLGNPGGVWVSDNVLATLHARVPSEVLERLRHGPRRVERGDWVACEEDLDNGRLTRVHKYLALRRGR